MKLQYSVVIEWSDEDNAFLVTLPEFGSNPQTHGETYKEAMKHALEVMETLVDFHQEKGQTLPEPNKYQDKKPNKKRGKKVLRHAETA